MPTKNWHQVEHEFMAKKGFNLAAHAADHQGLGFPLNVKDFGAKGDGASDDTIAINAAAAASSVLYFPKGTYVYNGSGINAPVSFEYTGAGRGLTTINLGASSRFIDSNTLFGQMRLSGFTFNGGLGALRNTNTAGWGGSGKKFIEKNEFIGYTKCAIDTNHDDGPYWHITGNVFKAANSITTIGVALSRNSDVSVIRENAFERNAVHVKLWKPGYVPAIESNDFIQWDAGTARISVWITGNNTNRNYVNIVRNKFGNENQSTTDYRIALVPELAGTYNGDRLPDFTTLAMDGIHCIRVEGNDVNGITGGGPLVYSVSGELRGSYIGGNTLGATAPSYLLQYGYSTFVDNPYEAVQFGEHYNEAAITSAPINLCNIGYYGTTHDPRQLSEGDYRNPNSSLAVNLSRTGYVELLSTRIGSFSLANATKIGDISDSTGGTEAAEFSVVNAAEIYKTWSVAPTPGQVMWVELELAAGSTNSVNQLGVQIYTTSSTAPSYWYRRCNVPSATEGWKIFRFSLGIGGTQATRFKLLGLSTGQVKIGRVRVYHSRSPVPLGTAQFDGLSLANMPTTKSVPANQVFVDAANQGRLRLSNGVIEQASSGTLSDKYFGNITAAVAQTVYTLGLTTGYPNVIFTFDIVGNRYNNGQQTKRKIVISASGTSSTANSVASVGTLTNTLEFQDNAAWDFTVSISVVSGKLLMTVTPTTYNGDFQVVGRWQAGFIGAGGTIVTEN